MHQRSKLHQLITIFLLKYIAQERLMKYDLPDSYSLFLQSRRYSKENTFQCPHTFWGYSVPILISHHTKTYILFSVCPGLLLLLIEHLHLSPVIFVHYNKPHYTLPFHCSKQPTCMNRPKNDTVNTRYISSAGLKWMTHSAIIFFIFGTSRLQEIALCYIKSWTLSTRVLCYQTNCNHINYVKQFDIK